MFTGFNGATFSNAPNAGDDVLRHSRRASTVRKPRTSLRRAIQDHSPSLRKNVVGKDRGGADVLVIPPPPVRGIGTGGGFKMLVEDGANAGPTRRWRR